MKWDIKYRPERFDEVAGQVYAVKLLSSLVTHRSDGRHLLLHGAVGSGKTTLVRIFARAMNCARPDATGSPCNTCQACRDVGKYLFEYDVPGRSGEKDKVAPWVDLHNRKPTESRTKVVFFDEAHALTHATQDLLLKRVEEPAPGVLFCFATTEVDRIVSALRSRLLQVPIREIAAQTAVDHLQKIVVAEGMSYDRAALYLLAAAKPPYLRDLVIALETLNGLAKHVDTTLVQEVFDLDAASHAGHYWKALASGDLSAQLTADARWPDSVDAKVRWIRLFLTTMYYNDILGQHVVLDPLVHSQEQERKNIAGMLRDRLCVKSVRELVPFFEAMLNFWGENSHGAPDVLQLQLARFSSFVNRSLRLEKVGNGHHIPVCENSIPQIGKAVAVADCELEILPARSHAQFIDSEDVALVVNRASFLPQHYGKYFNSLFRVEIQLHEAGSETAAFDWVVDATKAFTKICVEHENESGGIVLVEREGGTMVARIAAVVPSELIAPMRTQLDGWWSLPTRVLGSSWELNFAEGGQPQRFHRSVVLELCAGFQAAADDALVGHAFEQVVKRHRARVRRPGPLDCPRLIFWSLLTTKSIEAASEFGMAPLSAIDDHAWSSIFDGWEIEEHRDRRHHIEERRNAITELAHRHQGDPNEVRKHMEELKAQWAAQDPWERPRTWRGWR